MFFIIGAGVGAILFVVVLMTYFTVEGWLYNRR